MMKTETEYLQILNDGMGLFGMGFDLNTLNKKINQFYSKLTDKEQKLDFIDYIEFSYLPKYRVNQQQFTEVQFYIERSNEKIKYLESWAKQARSKIQDEIKRPATGTKKEQDAPKTFEELFYHPEHADPCLKILSELQPPVIDAINNYIGKAKGVFPLWVKVLKNHKPEPLIKHFKDAVYKDLLNQKINGLNLSKDASEFRKQYTRVENDKIELDIKTILSQYSQSGKLGK